MAAGGPVSTYAVGDTDPTPDLDDVAEYCWAPYRLPERTVYCSWPVGHVGDHVSADVTRKGQVVVAVYPDADPPAGRVWSPRDRRPWAVGPDAMGMTADDWTDDMAREGARTGVNRQCSIGWHGECSHRDYPPEEPTGCRCACHGS